MTAASQPTTIRMKCAEWAGGTSEMELAWYIQRSFREIDDGNDINQLFARQAAIEEIVANIMVRMIDRNEMTLQELLALLPRWVEPDESDHELLRGEAPR